MLGCSTWLPRHTAGAPRPRILTIAALALLTLAFANAPADAQGTIRGIVRARETHAPLADVAVSLAGSQRTVLTSSQGRFVLAHVPAGVHTLLVRRLGYLPATVVGIAADNDSISNVLVELAPAAPPLDTVVVHSEGAPHTSPAAARGIGGRPSVILTREDIALSPQVAPDPFRAISRVPGVSASDFSAGFRVRGGKNREVLLLFDGVELHEPFHLKELDGALSILDPETVGGASLSTGGFGARYGGRLTGVFDLRSPDEPVLQTRTTISAAVSGVSIMRTAPLARGRGDWLVSARHGFLGPALALAGESRQLSPRYADLFTRLRFRPASRHELAIGALRADDWMRYAAEDRPHLSSTYGSTYAWLTWRATPSERVTGQSVVSLARLGWRRDGSLAQGDESALQVSDHRNFEALAVKQEWTIGMTDRIDLELGGQLQRHTARYDYQRSAIRPRVRAGLWAQDATSHHLRLAPAGTALGAYIAPRFRPAATLMVEAGVRYDRASHTREGIVAPRASLTYTLGAHTTMRAAWGSYAQPLGLYELQVQDGVDQFPRAERAEHTVLGIDHEIVPGISVGIAAYERRLSRIAPRYINLEASFDAFPEAGDDRVLFAPSEGTARGVELSLGGRRGGAQWSASYALATTRHAVDGRQVASAFDQRHTLSMDANLRLPMGWRVSAAWQLHSGWPATPLVFGVDTLLDGSHHVTVRYGALNTERLPAFHRLDLRVSNHRKLGKGELSIFLDVFNVYDRDNPRGLGYTVADWNAAEALVDRRPKTQLPRLPTIGVRWTF